MVDDKNASQLIHFTHQPHLHPFVRHWFPLSPIFALYQPSEISDLCLPPFSTSPS